MSTQHSADVAEFHDEMGDHPLGDRERSKAVGPYVVEQYRRVFGYHRRSREGKPERGVVTVHEKVPPGEEHFRNWYARANGWFGTREAAGEAFDSLETTDDVAAFVAEHGDD